MQLHEVSAVDSDVGIRLRFTLPAGGYATVVVEELLANGQSSKAV